VSSEDSWVLDGRGPPRGFSHRIFTIDLGNRSVNTSEGIKVGEVEGRRAGYNPMGGRVRVADLSRPWGIPRYHWVNSPESGGIPALTHPPRTGAAELCKCARKREDGKKLHGIVLKRNKGQ